MIDCMMGLEGTVGKVVGAGVAVEIVHAAVVGIVGVEEVALAIMAAVM